MGAQKRQHVCDTENPQRPCCWMARRAELEAMSTPEAVAKQQAAQAEHSAEIKAQGGFITRGLD
jgi:hypothetical protein